MSATILEQPEIRKAAFSFSIDQYHCLISDKSTELLKGQIIKKMPKSPLHTIFLGLLSNFLRSILPENYCLRQESPIVTFDSEPEPDIAIVNGSFEEYFPNHPKTAVLVIEVSISSLELDRAKAIVYAEAEIPEYWIIRPDVQIIEIYKEPINGKYLTKKEEPFENELKLFGKEIRLTHFLPNKHLQK